MNPSDKQRLQASISGRVQGVGFRWYVQREAGRLRLEGWVANHADGSVEVVAEGSLDDLECLLVVLRKGPAASSVRDVSARYEPARGNLAGFAVRTGEHRGD